MPTPTLISPDGSGQASQFLRLGVAVPANSRSKEGLDCFHLEPWMRFYCVQLNQEEVDALYQCGVISAINEALGRHISEHEMVRLSGQEVVSAWMVVQSWPQRSEKLDEIASLFEIAYERSTPIYWIL